jgi:hypothetical protein
MKVKDVYLALELMSVLSKSPGTLLFKGSLIHHPKYQVAMSFNIKCMFYFQKYEAL